MAEIKTRTEPHTTTEPEQHGTDRHDGVEQAPMRASNLRRHECTLLVKSADAHQKSVARRLHGRVYYPAGAPGAPTYPPKLLACPPSVAGRRSTARQSTPQQEQRSVNACQPELQIVKGNG